MDLRIVISQWPRLSPTLYEKLRAFTNFKVDFHNVSIMVWKDSKITWHELIYLVLVMDVHEIVGSWEIEWREPKNLDAGTNKGAESSDVQLTTTQKCKDATQKVAQALAKQKRKEVAAKGTEEKENVVKEHAEPKHTGIKEVKYLSSKYTNEQELLGQEGGGGEGWSTPFTLKKCGKEMTIGHERNINQTSRHASTQWSS